jgi:hypothetical protein
MNVTSTGSMPGSGAAIPTTKLFFVMMKKILIALLILAAIAIPAGIIWYKSAAKHADPLESENKVEISAEQLFTLFNQHEDSANALYLDKTISISGKIREIELNNNRYTLTFHTNDSSGAVICEMDTVENARIKALQPNSEVNVVGFCNGFLMDVQLDRCKLAK